MLVNKIDCSFGLRYPVFPNFLLCSRYFNRCMIASTSNRGTKSFPRMYRDSVQWVACKRGHKHLGPFLKRNTQTTRVKQSSDSSALMRLLFLHQNCVGKFACVGYTFWLTSAPNSFASSSNVKASL